MNIPVNGETFIPTLCRDYLTYVRTNLGLASTLTIAAWPYLDDFVRPQLGIAVTSFTIPSHPTIQEYTVEMLLDYGVDGTPPATKETAAQSLTRRAAILTLESKQVSLIRAAFALKTGQTFTNVGSVVSFFDWITNTRTVPGTEDGWALEDFRITGGGGSLMYDAEKRTRHRSTTYYARLMTNEFTV